MYSKYRFKGDFRPYQKRVLDHAETYLEDNKINIVAAPGSGKTILGLELIRRINKPALIISPTVTIQHQWGMRLSDNFTEEGCGSDISYSLKSPSLVTSITYQALHAANKKLNLQADINYEDEFEDISEDLAYEGFNLYTKIKDANIGVICLDEAHHLKAEWKQSLTQFISTVNKDVTVISLTATPPFDSTQTEWDHYTSISGEIDEEISIPELVQQKTLCPHQDFVYFNFPTESENKFIKSYETQSKEAVTDIIENGYLLKCIDTYQLLTHYELKVDEILEFPLEFSSLLAVMKHNNLTCPRGLVRTVSPKGTLPPYKAMYIQVAFQFIINNPDKFGEDNCKELISTFKRYGLMQGNKLYLEANPKVTKTLISSLGKLESIKQIVKHEYGSRRKSLRMLILTDYIHKEYITNIGTQESINALGTVPIFELLRREESEGERIGAVSGSLLLLPTELKEVIEEKKEDFNFQFTMTSLTDTNYSEYRISGGNKNIVKIATYLFEEGHVQILVGTKSLLGEGWDSPSINTLILASFVGSYMLSNQMRGRAIRIDPNNPQKVSNIWHLVTLPAPSGSSFSKNQVDEVGGDYEMLERRFQNFIGPSYDGLRLAGGLNRLGISRNILNRGQVEHINKEMLERSNNRAETRTQWYELVGVDEDVQVNVTHEVSVKVPENIKMNKHFVFMNVLSSLTISGIITVVIIIAYSILTKNTKVRINTYVVQYLFTFIAVLVSKFIWYFGGRKKRMETFGKAICDTLVEMKHINRWANSVVTASDDKITTNFYLENANDKESALYARSVEEFFTAIENPRYLIYKKKVFKRRNYYMSYTCPTIISTNQKSVEKFVRNLSRDKIKYGYCYTRSKEGRKELIKARYSYISKNDNFIHEEKRAKKSTRKESWQ
ncbi:MAG: DEAD/DEAH box helicase family protein [Erysipelothrix sp.]